MSSLLYPFCLPADKTAKIMATAKASMLKPTH